MFYKKIRLYCKIRLLKWNTFEHKKTSLIILLNNEISCYFISHKIIISKMCSIKHYFFIKNYFSAVRHKVILNYGIYKNTNLIIARKYLFYFISYYNIFLRDKSILTPVENYHVSAVTVHNALCSLNVIYT